MIRTTTVTLRTLPVEILHQIFDDLDAKTVFLSVRDVCQRLRATVDVYQSYELDLTSLSKPDFHRLLRVIRLEWVAVLSVSNANLTPGQIGVFRSLIDIDLFTRLRSLTLLKISGRDLCPLLEHVRRCSLTSLTIDSKWCDPKEQQQIAQCLSSIIDQPAFLRLQLLSEGLCRLIDQLEWPVHCKLKYLTMTFFTKNQVFEILFHAANLQTLVLGTRIQSMVNNRNSGAEISLTPYSRLTSLIMSSRWQLTDTILSLLSFTPCLRHLKIVSTDVNWLAGSRCEELIKSKLPALSKLQFYSSSHLRRSEEETEESTLNRLMSPFRTSFWTKEKRWSVTCNWLLTQEMVEIYTSPLCTRNYNYYADPDMQTVSNFATEDRQTTISTGVYQLSIDLRRRNLVEQRVS